MAVERPAHRWERWERLAPLAGIGTVILWIAAVLASESGDTPDEGSGAEAVAYFENDETSIYVSATLLFLGALLLIWFAGSLRSAIAANEPRARLASIAFAAAVATAIFAMAVDAPRTAGAFAANEADAPLDPGAAQALWAVGDGFFLPAAFSAALLLVATAVAALRWRILPAWLAWASLLIALVMLIPPIAWAGLIFAFPL